MSRNAQFFIFFIGFGILLLSSLLFFLYDEKHISYSPLKDVNWEALKSDPEMLHRGEFQFKVRCSSCHAFDAKGSLNAPDLTDSEWLYSKGDYEGVSYIIQNGTPSGLMKGWGRELQPDDIVAITVYVKSLGR